MAKTQVKICTQNDPADEWITITSDSQIDLIQTSLLEWRQAGLGKDEIWLEYRKRPNIFTRIKEWWNNQ